MTELFEKQTSYAQTAFEGFVSQATKMNEIYVAAAKDITAPLGARVTAATEALKSFSLLSRYVRTRALLLPGGPRAARVLIVTPGGLRVAGVFRVRRPLASAASPRAGAPRAAPLS